MGIIGKLIFRFGMPVMDLIIMQNIIQIALLVIYFAFNKFQDLKLRFKDLKTISIQGLLGSVPVLIFYYITLQRISASIACMLLFTNPIFITLYFILFEKQKANSYKIIAVCATFVGSLMVLNITPENISNLDIIGVITGFISSISYAFYNIYADKKLRNYSPGAILFYCCIVVVTFVSVINPGFYFKNYFADPELIKYVFVLAIVTGILPVVFLYAGINRLGAQIASVVATGEIPVTLLMSNIILHERLLLIQIIGSVLIMGAIVLLNRAVEDHIIKAEDTLT